MADLNLLDRRVATLEQEVEGEKLVSRYTLEQARRNGDDLAALRSRMDRVEARLDRVEAEVRGLRVDLNALRGDLGALRRDLPVMIAETLREVLRERHA